MTFLCNNTQSIKKDVRKKGKRTMHTIKQRNGPDLGLRADQSGSPRNREWETEKQHELKQPTPLDWSGIGRSWRKTRCMQRAACVSLLRRRHLLLLLLLLWVDLQWLLWQPRPTFSSNPLEHHSSGTLPSQNVREEHGETSYFNFNLSEEICLVEKSSMETRGVDAQSTNLYVHMKHLWMQ